MIDDSTPSGAQDQEQQGRTTLPIGTTINLRTMPAAAVLMQVVAPEHEKKGVHAVFMRLTMPRGYSSYYSGNKTGFDLLRGPEAEEVKRLFDEAEAKGREDDRPIVQGAEAGEPQQAQGRPEEGLQGE